MSRRTMLVVGLVALAASIIGPAVQASFDGTWWSHMVGHHGGWGSQDELLPGAPEITVSATDFGFEPSEIRVTAAEPVNLTLRNEGDLAHDLVVPELHVRIVAGPGDQATSGLVVPGAGTFEFFCGFPGHADAGMTGVIVADEG